MRTDQSRQLKKLRADLLDSFEKQRVSIQNLTPAQLSISRQLQEIQSLITIIPRQHRILRHLIPNETGSRQAQILEADPDTCRWILESVNGDFEEYRQDIRNDFMSWLRTGSDVLHISGNPGAGKSTLMKFIAGSPKAQEELRAWAGSRRLIFGQFYFWAAGTEAQRTLLGMLRALLYQVLSQNPGLIEHVFPRQWRQMETSRFQPDPTVESFQDFGSKQIQEAFDLLLKEAYNSDHRICFLIDGLDEFEGDELDQEDLAVRLKNWTTGGNIKLVVSSRPWDQFLKTFTAYPTLHLHKLNSFDIRTHTIRQLEQDRKICQIGLDRMKKTIEDIVEEVVSQAQGIFLWAHLALTTLRKDIRRGYSVDLLKAKLQEYPSDLDGLYDELRKPIEKSPIDSKLSNRMLLLAAAAPKDFPLLAMAFSWLPEDDKSELLDPSFPPSTKCQPYPEQDVAERLKCVSERINGLTRGLLELVTVEAPERGFTPQEVRFCHRTARDYLVTNVKRYTVLEDSWPNFHQSDPYGRIYLAELIYSRISESPTVSMYLNKPFCRIFSLGTTRKFETPMQPLLSPRVRPSRSLCLETNREETVSFIQYAAYCGLSPFVLSEVDKNHGAYPRPHGTSILLASMYPGPGRGVHHGNYGLALELLQSYKNKADVVGVNVQVRDQDQEMPVWVAALILGLGYILYGFGSAMTSTGLGELDIDHRVFRLCRLLDGLGAELGQSLSVTVFVDPMYMDLGDMDPEYHEDRVEMKAVQLVEWAEALNSGSESLQGNVMEERDLLSAKNRVLKDIPMMMRFMPSAALSQSYTISRWTLYSTTGAVVREGSRSYGLRVF